MLVTLNDNHIGKELNVKGFKFVIHKEDTEKGRYYITTPHYRNNAVIFAGTLTQNLHMSVVRLIKTLENQFLVKQVVPRIGDTYHNFDDSKYIRTIVDVKFSKEKQEFLVVTCSRQTKDLLAGSIDVNIETGEVAISLGFIQSTKKKPVVEQFVCSDFVFLEMTQTQLNVGGMKVGHNEMIWKGVAPKAEVVDEKQVSSPQET